MNNSLNYPFNIALDHGHTIYYKCALGDDHEYVRRLGYAPHLNEDCAYSAEGLYGISLSSYGNSGAFYPNFADEIGLKIFMEMISNGIVRPNGIMAYIRDEDSTSSNRVVHAYRYNDGEGWQIFQNEEWVDCGDPFKK